MLRLAERHHDPASLLEAHWALGGSFFCFGDFTAAWTQLEQSIALNTPEKHQALAWQYGHDPGMSSLCFVAHTLWHLGYPEQALKRSQEAVALARKVAHPYSLAYALGNTAWFHQFRREPSRLKSEQRPPSRSRTSKDLPTGQRIQRLCAAGRWPSREEESKVWRRCATGSRRGKLREPSCSVLSGLPC